MMKLISSWIYHTLLGWKHKGVFPKEIRKYVIIVYPHTSWRDFPMGLLIKYITGIQPFYIGKKSLFQGGFGWFFRYLGGIPVDRTKNQKVVDQIVAKFNSKQDFIFALSPEGTRKKVKKWKTGFYYIAKEANVPIVRVALDYGLKEVRILAPYFAKGDLEEDMKNLQMNFKETKGYHPDFS